MSWRAGQYMDTDKHIMKIRKMFFVFLLTAVAPVACEHRERPPGDRALDLRIERNGEIAWECSVYTETKVAIKGHVFSISRGMPIAFEKLSRLSKQAVQRARELQVTAPTSELRPASVTRWVSERGFGLAFSW
jgi:hypothetical protein